MMSEVVVSARTKPRHADRGIYFSFKQLDMKHVPFQSGNLHGAQRPVVAIKPELLRAASKWASANLPGYSLPELEQALLLVKRHPDQASPGYSKAKSARQRLELEINRQKALPKA